MPEDVSPDNAIDTRSDTELDALADSNEVARNSERPMSAPQETEKAPEVKEEVTYEFVHNGRPVKATKEQLIKWAQQGYDYPQKAQKLNLDRQKWEKDRQDWESKWGVYRQIDDFARQNQDWWNFVQEQWNSKGKPGQAQATNGSPTSQFDPNRFAQELEQKLLGTIDQKFFQPAREQQEDAALEKDVQSMREQYKHLDWDSLDEHGRHLELRILEHAQQNGIPTFRAALRDLLHDELISKAEAQGKIAVSKGIQQKTKIGVLGESPTPSKGMPPTNRNIKNMSYEDLMHEAMEDVRAGRA